MRTRARAFSLVIKDYDTLRTLLRWGDEHLAGPEGPPVILEHRCGHRLVPEVTCQACGEPVDPADTCPAAAGSHADIGS